MIVISSKGKIGKEEKVLIMVGNKVVGEVPKSALSNYYQSMRYNDNRHSKTHSSDC
jgi:hypothetical protein